MSEPRENPNAQGFNDLNFRVYVPVADGSIASTQYYGMGRGVVASPTPPAQQIRFESLLTPSTMAPATKSKKPIERFRPSTKFAISHMELPPLTLPSTQAQPKGAQKRKGIALNHSNPEVACKTSKKRKLNGSNQVEQMSNSTQTVDTSDASLDNRLSENAQLTSMIAAPGEASSIPGTPNQTDLCPAKIRSRAKERERHQATVLRKDKPVATQVPLDVWRRVLEFCPLGFLVKARTISRDFHLALTYETTWRRARKRTYGHDCPDPPASLTEFQFADLVSGTGCQSNECSGTGKCRKIYWAYQRRWCENCLNKRIVMEHSMSAITNEYSNLTRCVYFATFDGWDSYQCTGKYDQVPTWIRLRSQGTKKGFERRAVANAMHEIDELLGKDLGGTRLKSPEEINDWFTLKETRRDELVRELQTFETWWENLRLQRLDELQDIRANRITLFEEKAMTMEPPMTPAALHKTVSFQRAIKIGRTEPNHRSWKMLEKKLQAERMIAERLVKEEEEDSRLTPDEPGNLWQRMDGCPPVTVDKPDRTGLFEVADLTIQRLGIEDGPSGVADEDIVPLVLKEIRKDYYGVDDSQALEVERSFLRLVLEDAKEIYEKKLEPIISGWGNKAREKAATLLKCPFCTKKNGNTRWTFPHLMLHVGEQHAMCSTDLTPWHPRKEVFPWHRIDWPRNLPIITGRQNVPGKWDLSADTNYCHETPVTSMPSAIASSKSAFENRSVAHELGSIDHKNFIENVLYAADRFRNTSLASRFVAQIVLQFALRKYHIVDSTGPAFSICEPLQLALLRKDHHALFDGFKCRWCCEEAGSTRTSRFVNRGQPFGELVHHFGLFPHPRSQWATKALNFPTEEELYAALQDPSQEHAFEIFKELFPITDLIDTARGDDEDELIFAGEPSLSHDDMIITEDHSSSLWS